MGTSDYSDYRIGTYDMVAFSTWHFSCAKMSEVISYFVTGALADKFPAPEHFNRGAAILQVMFIYIIETVINPSLLFFLSTDRADHYLIRLTRVSLGYAHGSTPARSSHLMCGIKVSTFFKSGQQMTTLWINQVWPDMFDNVGHNAHYILVGINFFGLASVVLFWNETKEISHEDMDRLFDGFDRVEAYREAHSMGTGADEKRILEEVEARARDFTQ